MTTDNRTNGQIVAKALVAHCEEHKMPFPRGSVKKIVEALRDAGRLAGEPTETQVEAAADARLPSVEAIYEVIEEHDLKYDENTSPVDYRKALSRAIYALFGRDIGNVKSIEMAAGEVVITYWPTLSDRSRIVTDTYRIRKEESNV